LIYKSGEEIKTRDRVLLHGKPAEIEFVLDGENNPSDWPAEKYGRGIMIAEQEYFGSLFLTEEDIKGYEDLEFVSRQS